MSTEEKIKKLNANFITLPEESKQYVVGVIDALSYASEVDKTLKSNVMTMENKEKDNNVHM